MTATYDDSRFTYDVASPSLDYGGTIHSAISGSQDAPGAAAPGVHGSYFRSAAGSQPAALSATYDGTDSLYDDPVLVYDQGGLSFISWRGQYFRLVVGAQVSGSGGISHRWVDRPLPTYIMEIVDRPEDRLYAMRHRGNAEQQDTQYQLQVRDNRREIVYRERHP